MKYLIPWLSWFRTRDPMALARLMTAKSGARSDISVSLLTENTSTTDGTSVSTASVSPASNAVIYAAVQYTATAETPTCAGNGLTWVEVHTQACGATDALTVFRAMGASPSAGAITFTWVATQTSFIWSVVQCSGVDTSGTNGSGATNQAVKSSGSGVTTLQMTLSPLENAKNVMLVFYGLQGSATCEPDADFAELSDRASTSPTSSLSAEWAVNQTVCDPTFSSSQTCAGVAIEVKAG